MADKDPLDNEISVKGELTETGLAAKVKSRFASAADRLLGSIVDAVNIPIERRNSRERAKIDAERLFIETASRALAKQIETNPQLAQQAIESLLRGIVRKQENKEAVVEVASEDLNRLLDPDAAPLEQGPSEIDEDWLNFFEPLAEKASSDKMRQLFGRILSGEIRKPGAFSFTTLRIASELDQRTAKLFEQFAGARWSSLLPLIEVSTSFENYLDLETAGLINFNEGKLANSPKANEDGELNLMGQEYVWRVQMPDPNQALKIPAARLTKAGVELASLLPNDELAAFKQFLEATKGRFVAASIHKIVERNGSMTGSEKTPLIKYP